MGSSVAFPRTIEIVLAVLGIIGIVGGIIAYGVGAW